MAIATEQMGFDCNSNGSWEKNWCFSVLLSVLCALKQTQPSTCLFKETPGVRPPITMYFDLNSDINAQTIRRSPDTKSKWVSFSVDRMHLYLFLIQTPWCISASCRRLTAERPSSFFIYIYYTNRQTSALLFPEGGVGGVSSQGAQKEPLFLL